MSIHIVSIREPVGFPPSTLGNALRSSVSSRLAWCKLVKPSVCHLTLWVRPRTLRVLLFPSSGSLIHLRHFEWLSEFLHLRCRCSLKATVPSALVLPATRSVAPHPVGVCPPPNNNITHSGLYYYASHLQTEHHRCEE